MVLLAIGDRDGRARVEARDLATGALRWQTLIPGSFDASTEPAADGRDVVVVDDDGVVSLLDFRTGALRWRDDVDYFTSHTEMTLTARRVVFRTFSGRVFVLARADGHLVAQMTPRQLGGDPVAVLRAPWPGPDRFVVALRYDTTRVDLRTMP